MKKNMKRFMAIVLCMTQLFACLPQGHGHAHAEETCTHPNAEHTNTYYSLSEGGTWTDNGDGTHSGLSRLVNWWYCFECGNGWAEYMTEPAMNTEAHSYEDGVCGRCGAVNACTHENATRDEVWFTVDASYTEQRNGDVHVKWMEPAFRYQCPDCGTTWFDHVTGKLVGMEMNHEYAEDSNVCTVCGYVDDCAHESTTTEKKHYGPIDSMDITMTTTTHTFWEQSYDATVCAECGKYMGGSSNWQEYQVTEEHMFTDAYVCFICGYQGSSCSHPNGVQTGGHKENEAFLRIDAQQHLHTFDVYWDYSCADCSGTYSLFIESGSEVRDHAYIVDTSLTACNQCGMSKPCTEHSYGENGVCTVCGDCPHTDNIIRDYNSYVDSTETYNDQFHKVNNISEIKRECETCGVTYMSYTTYVVYVAHAFDASGICACGAEGETTTCAHATTNYATYDTNEVYSDITADQHTKTCDTYFYFTCADCGAVTQYEELLGRTTTQDHTYTDGVCACGATETTTTCTHPAESVTNYQTWKWVEGSSYTEYLNGDYHVQWMQPALHYTCSACGETWDDPVSGTLVASEFSHNYGEDGACTGCGYVNTCEHAETTTVWEYGELETYYGFTITEEGHTGKQHYTEYTACAACGKHMSYGSVVGTKTVTEDHQYTDGGVCFVCGYVKETHLHTAGTQTGAYQEQLGSVQLSETHHVRMFNVYGEYTCSGCGETYSALIEAGSETEEHVFVTNESGVTACNLCGFEKPACTDGHTLTDGVCSVCGYCQHTQGGSFLGSVSTQSPAEKADDQFHKVVKTINRKYQCSVCGDTYLNIVELDLFYAHDYDASGVCVCGAEGETSTCEHLEVRSRFGEDNVVYSNVTDTSHLKDYDYYYYDQCVACGMDVYGELIHYSRTQDHTFTDGKCACGKAETACTEHSYEWSDYASVNGTPVYEDEQFHLLPYTVNNTYTCSVCSDSYVESTDYEAHKAHEYDENGLCACGAEGEPTTCAHTNKERRDYEANAVYSDVTESSHTKTYDYYSYTWCTDCSSCRTYQLVESGRTETEEHTLTDGVCACNYGQTACEKHTWADGKCSVCDAECAHEESTFIEEKRANAQYTIIDDIYHSGEWDLLNCYACNECGMNYTEDGGIGGGLEEHEYSSEDASACQYCSACRTHTYENGVCSVCGVKEPCEIHIFVEGECTECGRAEVCSHANASWSGRFKREESFAVIDETTHVHTFEVWDKYACPDCGDMYGVYLEDGFEVDDHAFIYDPNLTACNQCGMNKPCTEHSFNESGLCTVCGYCQHTWTSSGDHIGMEELDPESQDDDQFHIQPYLSYNFCQCNVCGETFVKASRMEGEVAHTFDENGLCACGATGETTTCAHANFEWGEKEYTFYSEKTLTQHTEKTDIYWCKLCLDCEAILQRQLDIPGTATAEDHSYVGGTCSECGYHYLTGLTSVYELPADLVEVEPEAFMDSMVEAVIVPDGCQKLAPAAFLNCTQLKVVVVPESVVYLYTDTFSGCPDVVVFAANPSAAQAFCKANGIAWLGVEF